MKYYFLGIVIALCTLIVTGCSKELDSISPPVGKQRTMAMQANTNSSQTRADYTDDGSVMKFSWRSGDKLSVVVDGVTGNENCQLSTSESGISTAFIGNVTGFTGSKDIYAFYPYNSTPYRVTGSGASATATLTLPNPQAYRVGGAISNSFMIGVGTATASEGSINASASMKQVMSIIKLKITNAPGKVTGVKLRCSEALFPTTAVVKLSDGTISNPGTLVKELSMTVTDETEGSNKEVSFAMFPTTGLKTKFITIEVTFNNRGVEVVRMTKKLGVEFKQNIHYLKNFDAGDYLVVNGIKVAVGNLVADGGGTGKIKIGTPQDMGLHFQFGSLVAWNLTNDAAIIAIKPTRYTGSSTWNQAWKGFETSDLANLNPDVKEESVGTGDPCRYYLGSPWRLPTRQEFIQLFTKSPDKNTWYLDKLGSSLVDSSFGLEFRFSGWSDYYTGVLKGYDMEGRYWTSTGRSKNTGYFGHFSADLLRVSYYSQALGHPVRCVQD